jgi:hypothetical protein
MARPGAALMADADPAVAMTAQTTRAAAITRFFIAYSQASTPSITDRNRRRALQETVEQETRVDIAGYDSHAAWRHGARLPLLPAKVQAKPLATTAATPTEPRLVEGVPPTRPGSDIEASLGHRWGWGPGERWKRRLRHLRRAAWRPIASVSRMRPPDPPVWEGWCASMMPLSTAGYRPVSIPFTVSLEALRC